MSMSAIFILDSKGKVLSENNKPTFKFALTLKIKFYKGLNIS